MYKKRQLYNESFGDGMPLVLLHGWGWHSGVWEPILSQLGSQFRVTVIDLPGFGRSPPLDHYTPDNIADLLLNAHPNPANWLGWSLGGLLVTWLAIHHPMQVERLVSVTSSPCFLHSEGWPGTRLTALEKFSRSLTEKYEQTANDFLTLQLMGSPHAREIIRYLRAHVLSHFPPSTEGLRGGLKLLQTMDLRNELPTIPCKSLHIFGSLDALAPASVITPLKKLLPEGEYATISRASHLPFLSHTDEFLRLIINFILGEHI
jgi:pimeloyl-[acyl-carrier protein] methyl ester esterase